MGTISDKLTYLNTTKSQLKDMINYGLDENKITSSTTFREYVSSIKEAFLEALRTPDTLFTNLPKKSASGSNISLTGVANAPMRITLQPSELTQASTPTPSSPQEVHTISGDNKVVVNGKNLFDKSREINSTFTSSIATALQTYKSTGKYATGYLDTGSKLSSNASYITSFTPCASGTTYTINKFISGGSNFSLVAFIDDSGSIISSNTAWSNQAYTHTALSNEKYIVIGININNSGVDNRDYMQIEVSSSPTTYEPYISQEADIDLSSKNLYNKNNNTANYFLASNGTPASSTNFDYTEYIPIKPNTTYITKGMTSGTGESPSRCYYDANKNFIIGYAHLQVNDVVNISPTNAYYMRESVKKVDADTIVICEAPYYDINYSKIGNYEDKFIRTSGKNLFDENKAKDNFFYNSSGTTTTDNTNKFINMEIPLKSSYTISWGNKINGGGIIAYARICEYNGNTFIKRTSIQDNNTTITVDSNTTKVIASVDAGPNAYFVDLMINEGTTPLPYEPYGNGTWYIKKNIGKVVLDGTESWGYEGGRFVLSFKISALDTSGRQPAYSNYFGYLPSGSADYGIFIYKASATNYQIYIYDKDYTTTSDFQTWLSTHNLILYYILNTPTYTQITGTLETQLENVYQKLLSYSGTTNISQVNNDLPFVMGSEVLQDLS